MSETTKKTRGVLFDLDGVLLDSEGQYSIFWEQMEKEYPTGVPDFANYIKGFHLTRILGYFPDEDVRQQVLDKLTVFERNMKFEFFPGALETGDRRVRPRLGLRHGAPPASRDVPGERGRLSSCLWNLGSFSERSLTRGQRYRTAHNSIRSLHCLDDAFCRLIDQIVVVRLQFDSNLLTHFFSLLFVFYFSGTRIRVVCYTRSLLNYPLRDKG